MPKTRAWLKSPLLSLAVLIIVVPDWSKFILTPDKALLLDWLKTLPLMVPPDNVVFITNGLIFNVELLPTTRTTSVLSIEPEESLNESSFFAQEIMVKLKRKMRVVYKTLFIFFPIFSIARNCNGAVFVSPAHQAIEGNSIIPSDRYSCT